MKHRPGDIDLFAAITLTIIAVALAFITPPGWWLVRILALPLVLLLPGYGLTSALFPKQLPGLVERLVFILGVSLVIVILSGLVLNWTPFGLRASSWAVFLGSISLGTCAIALVRRRRQSLPTPTWSRIRISGFTLRQGLLLGLAATITAGAIIVSIIGAQQQPRPGFTQLWILPAGGTHARNAVRLGVRNMESTAMEYLLVVDVDGKVVKEWPAIDLNQHNTWQATFVVPQTRKGNDTKVEALLYRQDAPTRVYRYVILWLGT